MMKVIIFRLIPKVFFIIVLLFVLPGVQAKSLAVNLPDMDVCRFGIASVGDPAGYPVDTLGVGGFLDWNASANYFLPSGTEYIRILRVSDVDINNTMTHLAGWLTAYPGSTWIVGNEPDTKYNGQDNLTAENYAERFYNIATLIRSSDPSAHIAFGTIVQPTPIRLRYLARVWEKLVFLAKDPSNASNLIDIWAIHSFLLNEKPNSWGTGVPPGFENDYGDAFITDDISTTYSISLFKERIINFRKWLEGIGERGKPVWITEYGSLIPPINAWWTNNQTVSDGITADFMAATYDFLLTATNSSTGMMSDQNLLVQRWFWFSLNDHRYNFGGTLFDPDNNRTITMVGVRFRDYVPPAGINSDIQILPGSSVMPVLFTADGSQVDYLVKINIGTSLTSNAPTRVRVSLYEENLLVTDPLVTGFIQRCGAKQVAKILWKNVIPGSAHLLDIRVEALDQTDPNLVNNTSSILLNGSDLGYPENQIFLPVLKK